MAGVRSAYQQGVGGGGQRPATAGHDHQLPPRAVWGSCSEEVPLTIARINGKHKLVPFWVATPAGLLLVRPHYLPTLAATAAALPAA